LLHPIGVAGNSHENIWEAWLGASGSEGDDPSQVPLAVPHVAMKWTAGVAVAGPFASSKDWAGAQVLGGLDRNVVLYAIPGLAVTGGHYSELHLFQVVFIFYK